MLPSGTQSTVLTHEGTILPEVRSGGALVEISWSRRHRSQPSAPEHSRPISLDEGLGLQTGQEESRCES